MTGKEKKKKKEKIEIVCTTSIRSTWQFNLLLIASHFHDEAIKAMRDDVVLKICTDKGIASSVREMILINAIKVAEGHYADVKDFVKGARNPDYEADREKWQNEIHRLYWVIIYTRKDWAGYEGVGGCGYVGKYEKVVALGKGRITYDTGEEREGTLVTKTDDQGNRDYHLKLDGHIKIKGAHGSLYEGTWKDGKKDGKGKMTYSDGSWYDGEWKEDKYEGWGVRRSRDGRTYKGPWKDNKMAGLGEMTDPMGTATVFLDMEKLPDWCVFETKAGTVVEETSKIREDGPDDDETNRMKTYSFASGHFRYYGSNNELSLLDNIGTGLPAMNFVIEFEFHTT